MQTEFITRSPAETEELGARLARALTEAGVTRAFIAFSGDKSRFFLTYFKIKTQESLALWSKL